MWQNRIKEALKLREMSQTELAVIAKINQSTINTWCNNKRQPPYETIPVIAEILDVSEGWLAGFNVSPKRETHEWIYCNDKQYLPDIAGEEVLATIENQFGQRRTMMVFTGYGDFLWHCNYKDINMDNWKVIAWQPKPDPAKGGMVQEKR